MKVPKEVISYIRANVGERSTICFVGKKNGVCCYSAVMPNCKTGFPVAVTLDEKAQCLPNVWGDGWVNVGAFSFFSCLSLHRVFKGWELVSPKRVNFPVSTNIQEKAQ